MADVKASSIFGGAVTPQTCVNAQSSNGAAGISLANCGADTVAQKSLSGSLTANTLKSVLSISDRPGKLEFVALSSVDATSRTHRLKITLDGIQPPFFDSTTAAVTSGTPGIVGVGAVSSISDSTAKPVALPGSVTWKTSCLVEIASSLTETDKTNVYLRYQA